MSVGVVFPLLLLEEMVPMNHNPVSAHCVALVHVFSRSLSGFSPYVWHPLVPAMGSDAKELGRERPCGLWACISQVISIHTESVHVLRHSQTLRIALEASSTWAQLCQHLG